MERRDRPVMAQDDSILCKDEDEDSGDNNHNNSSWMRPDCARGFSVVVSLRLYCSLCDVAIRTAKCGFGRGRSSLPSFMDNDVERIVLLARQVRCSHFGNQRFGCFLGVK